MPPAARTARNRFASTYLRVSRNPPTAPNASRETIIVPPATTGRYCSVASRRRTVTHNGSTNMNSGGQPTTSAPRVVAGQQEVGDEVGAVPVVVVHLEQHVARSRAAPRR